MDDDTESDEDHEQQPFMGDTAQLTEDHLVARNDVHAPTIVAESLDQLPPLYEEGMHTYKHNACLVSIQRCCNETHCSRYKMILPTF